MVAAPADARTAHAACLRMQTGRKPKSPGEGKPVEHIPLFALKCVFFVSRWPYRSAFRNILTQLYRVSLSGETNMPLER